MALTQIVNDGLGASLTATSDGGAVTTSVQQGLLKSFVTFDSSTAVQDSFNIASLTDNGTGDTSQTITNAMSNTDYGCEITTGRDTGSGARSYSSTMTDGKSTTVQRMQNMDGRSTASAPARIDNPFTVAVNVGDLA